MDRINKFLESRQKKHIKTIKYKQEAFKITKEDLKTIREFKSGKCMDHSISKIPNRILTNEQIEPLKTKPKKDRSDYFNKRLREHYMKNSRPVVIKAPKNEIIDIWENENLDTLKNYTQEWIYSIKSQYEGKVEDLHFSTQYLDEELRRVYLKSFTPVDIKAKKIDEILPKLPDTNEMRPFPETLSFNWLHHGEKFLFNSIVCIINDNHVSITDLKKHKEFVNCHFDEPIHKVAINGAFCIVSSKKSIYWVDLESEDKQFKNIITPKDVIKDIYIDSTFIGYLTSKSICLYDSESFDEVKILKLKGDSPHSIKIHDDVVYASTHKGIMIDSVERSEIKHLGYVIDFAVDKDNLFAINNAEKLLSINKSLEVSATTVLQSIGFQLKYHPIYNLIAISCSDEIAFYKVLNKQCIPINTLPGRFMSISWDSEMPWLYAADKEKIYLFT
ncbi:hypothetical protein GINT2_001266 [Glugoides intestinalis]